MSMSERLRDREITRTIHRLFWRASFEDKSGLILNYLTRLPALLLYNIFIPIQIAYGIQTIVERRFDEVPGYAYSIVLLAIGYSILYAIDCWVISGTGGIGSHYILRSFFSY